MFVTGLARVRIKFRARELVRHAVVHRNKNLPDLNGRRDDGRANHTPTPRHDGDFRIRFETELRRIRGMNLGIGIRRIERAQHGGFASASVRVPLRARATPGEHHEGKIIVRWFGNGTWCIKEKLRLAIGSEEFAVGK